MAVPHFHWRFSGRQDRCNGADHAAGLRGVEGCHAYLGEMAVPKRRGVRVLVNVVAPGPAELAWPIAFLCISAAGDLSHGLRGRDLEVTHGRNACSDFGQAKPARAV